MPSDWKDYRVSDLLKALTRILKTFDNLVPYYPGKWWWLRSLCASAGFILVGVTFLLFELSASGTISSLQVFIEQFPRMGQLVILFVLVVLSIIVGHNGALSYWQCFTTAIRIHVYFLLIVWLIRGIAL